LSALNKKDIQASLIYDLRFHNSDRHLGNLLAQNEKVNMIDHGATLSADPGDLLKLEQLNLSQTFEEWDPTLKNYLLSLDEEKIEVEAKLLLEHDISEPSVSWMKKASSLLSEIIRLSDDNNLGTNSITPYDVGNYFLHAQENIWNEPSIDSHIKFFKDVLKEKQTIKNMGDTPSRGKMLLARRNYAKQQPNSNLVNILYGADINDQSHDRIDFKESIIGKFIK
jgi:hypothetical protein